MPTTPALAPLLERLDRLRARVRRLLAVAGVARGVAWAAALGTLSFLADWLLDLPRPVRQFVRLGLLDRPAGLSTPVFLLLLGVAGLSFLVAWRRRSGVAGLFAYAVGGIAGVLAWVVARHLVTPLRVRLPDEALALSVEERHRRLNDRLAAALDFDRELADPRRGESPAMMTRVVEEASREVQGIEFASVASGRGARRLVGVAALGVAVLAVPLVAMPDTAALWLRRSLWLEDVSWPRATTLVAVLRDADGRETDKDAAVPYTAALGQSVTIWVRARGRVPAEVEILDRVAAEGAAGRALAHRMRAVPEREGLFEHEFRDVRGDFTFTLRGGDDRDERLSYAVTVRVPPRISGLRSDLTFPSYLALPPRRVEGGTLSVPEGTRATVTFSSDAPVARAEAVLDDAPAALERVEGGAYRFSFVATKSLRYRLRIVTPDGRENDPAVDTYEVGVEPDTPPRPEWVWPRAPVEVTVNGRLPLFAQTRDDHAITGLWLEVVAGAAQPTRVPLLPRTADAPNEANDRAFGADAILSYLPLEISTIRDKDGKPLVAPTRFQARVVAVDSKGQEAAGGWTFADVLRPDEVERGFAGQRARVKAELERTRADLRQMRETVAGLSAAGAALGDPERQVLRELQFRQGKAKGELDRHVRTIGSLFTAYVYDRLGAAVPTERLLSILDRRHRAAFSRASDLKGATPGPAASGEPGADDADTDVFPWSLFDEVVAARRDRVVFDTGVLDKMIGVLEHALGVVETLAPAAQEAAATAARTGATADVAALAAAEDRLLQGLDATVSAMAEWQSLSELTLFLRRVIEEQEALHRDIKDLKKGGG